MTKTEAKDAVIKILENAEMEHTFKTVGRYEDIHVYFHRTTATDTLKKESISIRFTADTLHLSSFPSSETVVGFEDIHRIEGHSSIVSDGVKVMNLEVRFGKYGHYNQYFFDYKNYKKESS